METEEDIISNLPAHVIDKILSYLSLRDAVRTSILSSKWRYKWATVPNLIFDANSLLVSSQDQAFIKNKLVNIVDHVLLLHSGPTHKFKLSHRDLQGVNDIDRWILFLSRGSVKELVLEIWKGHRYMLPSSLYSCKNLIHLELFNCLVRPPLSFTGFRSLKSLDLQHVTVFQDVFDCLISNCPSLERLTLMNFDGFAHLNVNAPNLLFFDIGGVFEEVNFENTFQLAIVSIGLYINAVLNDQSPFSGNIGKFFAGLPCLQRLEVQNFFLKYLAAGKVPERLLNPCIELSYLSLNINFDDREECNAALCLLRSSPNLQELDILVRPREYIGAVPSLMLEDYQYSPFTHLRLIKITGISGIAREMNFINFLLANSPFLEKMTIKPASNDPGMELLKALVRLRRASVLAEIVYLDT